MLEGSATGTKCTTTNATTPSQKERIQFQNVSRLFDLERQRRANRGALEGQYGAFT